MNIKSRFNINSKYSITNDLTVTTFYSLPEGIQCSPLFIYLLSQKLLSDTKDIRPADYYTTVLVMSVIHKWHYFGRVNAKTSCSAKINVPFSRCNKVSNRIKHILGFLRGSNEASNSI